MKSLTSSQRRLLRARAHALTPVVLIGESGLSDGVLREIDRSLKSHELIKLRVAGADRRARAAWLNEICRALECAPVQQIGRILVLFRENPDKPVPRTIAPRRRPKRSYQANR